MPLRATAPTQLVGLEAFWGGLGTDKLDLNEKQETITTRHETDDSQQLQLTSASGSIDRNGGRRERGEHGGFGGGRWFTAGPVKGNQTPSVP